MYQQPKCPYLYFRKRRSLTLVCFFAVSILKAMTEGEQWREVKNTKFEYLENDKSFLDEIKSIFHNYLRAIICWIKEQYWTQALSYLRILRNAIIIKGNP